MTGKYILKGKEIVEEPDLLKWADWLEAHAKEVRLAQTFIRRYLVFRQYRVSTIFLGLDHSFGVGPPLVFETMVFGKGRANQYQERYSTYDKAIAGHARVVKNVRGF